jgi:hypothetical protein
MGKTFEVKLTISYTNTMRGTAKDPLTDEDSWVGSVQAANSEAALKAARELVTADYAEKYPWLLITDLDLVSVHPA